MKEVVWFSLNFSVEEVVATVLQSLDRGRAAHASILLGHHHSCDCPITRI